MFGHVRFQDGNMYTEQSKKLTLNGISNTHTPLQRHLAAVRCLFCDEKRKVSNSGTFSNANFHTACTAPAHTYLMYGFTVCKCLPTSFRCGGDRLSLWCWQDCILIESR